MQGHHRIVADFPLTGFGKNVASIGFPEDGWPSQIKQKRVIMGVPFPQEQTRFANEAHTLVEQQRTYELQSLDMQRVCVARSAEGIALRNGVTDGRSHGYTDIVCLLGTDGCTEGTPEQWLGYDDFVSFEDFWQYRPCNEAWPTDEWTPGPRPYPAWEQPLPSGMREALLFRYWRAIAARAIDVETTPMAIRPVRVCLGEEKCGQVIIDQAKAFFADVVVPVLPKAATRMLSMVAPIPTKALNGFMPTALAFIFPEETAASELLFDLRDGSFEPLSPQALAFAQQVMRGETCRYVEALYQACAHLAPNAVERAKWPVTADFFIAWDLYQLENAQLSSYDRLSLWIEVHQRLVVRHGYSDAQVDRLLAAVEPCVSEALRGQADAVGTEKETEVQRFMFLFQKALRVENEAVADAVTTLLCEHQRQGLRPFAFGHLTEEILSQIHSEARAQAVFQNILCTGYTQRLLDQGQTNWLCGAPFARLCNSCPALTRAIAEYLDHLTKARPECASDILPLTSRYLDPVMALRFALRSLIAVHGNELPDGVTVKQLQTAANAFDPENQALLAQYLSGTYCANRGAVEPFCASCVGIGQDMTQTLGRLLSDTQAQPLSAAEWNRLQSALLRRSANRSYLHDALLAYLQNGANAAVNEQRDAFAWLLAMDDVNALVSQPEKQRVCLQWFTGYYAATNSVPANDQFQQVLAWMRGMSTKARAPYEEAFKRLYEGLGNRAEAQAEAFIPLFQSVLGYPYLCDRQQVALRKRLRAEWQNKPYFEAVETQRKEWSRCGATDEILLQDPATSAAARDAAGKAHRTLQTPRDFLQAKRRAESATPDRFRQIWEAELRNTYLAQYETLLMQQQELAVVYDLGDVSGKLGVLSQLAGTQAYVAVTTVQKAERFIKRGGALWSAQEVMQQVRAVQQMGDSPLVAHLKELLAQSIAAGASSGALPFRRRMAAALIPAGAPGPSFQAEPLLRLLPWTFANQKPSSPDGLKLLSAIAGMLTLLGEIDPQYPELVCQALEQTHAGYTKAVRGDRKNLRKLIPWATDSEMRARARPCEAYVRWIKL